MAFKPLYVEVEGKNEQLMANGRMKNPLDPWAKQLKEYSKKKNKVDEDHIAMNRAQFMGSLYLYKHSGHEAINGKHPFWPADNLLACVKGAAKLQKLGKVFDSAVVCEPPGGRLIYDGPRDRYGLWKAEGFRHYKPTKRGVIACRPVFHIWKCQFQLHYNDETGINLEMLKEMVQTAGARVGLSEWPRRHGLFAVTSFKSKEIAIDVTK